MARLKKEDVSFLEIYSISEIAYKRIDNKKRRIKLDVLNAKATTRKNFEYDPSTKKWEQTGREFLFVFVVKTDPKSYIKQDTVKVHKYPITFAFKDIAMGVNSAFKWREGSQYKFRQPRKGMNKKQRIAVINSNIQKGIQAQFIFSGSMVLAKQLGCLYGRDTSNKKLPKKTTNPLMLPYFGKHAFFIASRLLVPLLNNPTRLSEYFNKPIKN